MTGIRLRPSLAMLVFLGVAIGYLAMAVRFPVAYIWATYEDLIGEWLQTWLFATAFLFSLLVALSKSAYRIVFGLLALALFYVVMEEISWGQRIFEFNSPEFFRNNNLQRETNLHNLLVGPYSTGLKDVIEWGLASALLLYGLIYPLTLRFGWSPARWLAGKGVPAPPLYLWPFFVTGAWLETAPFSFNEAEVAEILIALALAVTAAHYWFAQRRGLPASEPPPWPDVDSRRFALAGAGVLAIVVLLASLTTLAFYSDSDKRARTDARLLNGYEKFADRYERYARWETTAELLLLVHEREPGRTSVLRRIATAYRQAGREDLFEMYANRALDILLEIQVENPDKRSNNLYLAMTYRLLGDPQKSAVHARRAHELALMRAEERPESPNAAYWLGKTYRYLGNLPAARAQFERAFEMRPSSSKYRDAYFDLRHVDRD